MPLYLKQGMRLFRLYYNERLFLQGIMDSAIENTQTKDMKKCCECACRLLHSLSKSNFKLRAVVMKKIDTIGMLFFEGLFKRYDPYKALPLPLRGKSLSAQASELGLLQRTNAVRVDRATVKRECMMASTRIKMHMKEEIGRECRTVHVLQTKKKQCPVELQTLPTYGANSMHVRSYLCRWHWLLYVLLLFV
jgi:hypothetical protein